GRRAFERGSAADTLSAILKEDPPPLSAIGISIPPALERVVQRCLEKNPEERFQSARDLAFALEALSTPTGAPVSATSIGSPSAGRRHPRAVENGRHADVAGAAVCQCVDTGGNAGARTAVLVERPRNTGARTVRRLHAGRSARDRSARERPRSARGAPGHRGIRD